MSIETFGSPADEWRVEKSKELTYEELQARIDMMPATPQSYLETLHLVRDHKHKIRKSAFKPNFNYFQLLIKFNHKLFLYDAIWDKKPYTTSQFSKESCIAWITFFSEAKYVWRDAIWDITEQKHDFRDSAYFVEQLQELMTILVDDHQELEDAEKDLCATYAHRRDIITYLPEIDGNTQSKILLAYIWTHLERNNPVPEELLMACQKNQSILHACMILIEWMDSYPWAKSIRPQLEKLYVAIRENHIDRLYLTGKKSDRFGRPIAKLDKKYKLTNK